MNKKLVALAVAGALALPLAAQAQTANVTLYGRINMDMEVVSGRKPDGTDPNQFRVSSNTSRFGIRGTEALGGGLNAIFQIESGFGGDVGGGTIGSRETFVGLQGTWGTFKIGNFLAPYDDIHPIFGNTPTLNTGVLATSGVWANNGGNTLAGGSFDARHPNSIRYDSPNMSGLTFSVQYSNQESQAGLGPKPNSNVLSSGVFYLNGPLQLGLAYERHSNMRGVGLNDDGLSFAAAYNFGIVRPTFIYERLEYDTPTGNLKRDFWGFGAVVPMGPGTWYAFYGKAKDGKGGSTTRVGGFTSGDDTGANNYIINYTYPLSKRTAVFGGYTKIDNDSRASYNFGVNAYTPLAIGGSPEAWVLGAWHNF